MSIGDPVPAGTCPNCGALCHEFPSKPDKEYNAEVAEVLKQFKSAYEEHMPPFRMRQHSRGCSGFVLAREDIWQAIKIVEERRKISSVKNG